MSMLEPTKPTGGEGLYVTPVNQNTGIQTCVSADRSRVWKRRLLLDLTYTEWKEVKHEHNSK